MKELMEKLIKLKEIKSKIEREINVATLQNPLNYPIFYCKWYVHGDVLYSPLSEKRSNRFKKTKLKIAKEYLKLIDDEIKENEQKLKKLLK